MNLQVQPLKVLATREVVINRLDYSNYLSGITKRELDRLDLLAGDYMILASKISIEASFEGKRLPSDDWEYLKARINLPTELIKTIEGRKKFRISETKNGPRTWVISTVDGWRWELLSKKGDLLQDFPQTGPDSGGWGYIVDFIEDGRLVSVIQGYKICSDKVEEVRNVHNSITTDQKGNLMWEFMWSAPHRDIKITKVMKAYKCADELTNVQKLKMTFIALILLLSYYVIMFGIALLLDKLSIINDIFQ